MDYVYEDVDEAHGNHAAFFLRFEGNGIWVMDQWARPGKKTVSSRYIRARTRAEGNPSDNANNYLVIE
jgi:hypothetical protein